MARRLLVRHFVDLLFHHVPAAVDHGFRDAWNLLRGVLDVGRQFERDGTERTGWDELDFDDARLGFLDFGYHLHLSETHAGFGVLDFANFLTHFIF